MCRRTYLISGFLVAGLALISLWYVAEPTGKASTSSVTKSSLGEQSTAPNILSTLSVDTKLTRQIGIQLAPATVADRIPISVVPAIVQPPANARVAVAATFPGTVTRTLVVEGETVRKGQPLAIISSREMLTMGADLTRAWARLGVARSNAARLSQLSREGIIAGARADEANAAMAEVHADVSEKSRILKTVNGNGQRGTYTLTSPIAGRVTTAAIQAGTPVDGTTAPYVIDAAGRYEVVGQLPERLIDSVHPGMIVQIAPDISGPIIAVGSTIDPVTRSASLKAEIPSGPGVVSGRATSLTIFGPAPAGAVHVPETAVTVVDGKDVVFVERPGGFSIREIAHGAPAGNQVVVVSGLKPGEKVVVTGTSALKALALSR